ncbi:MAG: sigma-E factor negative regulatory protein [Burkholderiales bacterium]
MTSMDSADRAARMEQLSALADGELGDTAAAQACAVWRGDADAKASWHAFHLIGDVLRSEDLATDPVRDASFLAALRLRLDAEPVVLAPQPLEHPVRLTAPALAVGNGASRAGRRPWRAASVVAAGFVAVAGVVVLTRGPATLPADATLAQGAASLPAVKAPTPLPVSTEPQVLVANGKLIRDVRLDRYLAAHKQFAGTSALGVPSGFLRSATADASDR